MRHLPECEAIPIRRLMEEWLAKHPDDEETRNLLEANISRDSQAAVMKCADSCPVLAKSIERGRELAERYGW